MAELQNFDMVGAYSRGYGSGAQMRDDRRQQQDQAQIRALAPQIVGGDLAAYQQAAAVDPAAAQQLQGAGDVTFKRLAGAYKLVDDARKSGDIRAVNAALKQTAPFFSQVLGKPVPTEWAVNDPAWEEGWGKLGQQIAMAQTGSGTQGRVQSTYVDGDGQRVAIMADGTQKVLGANDSGMSQQTISITGADGKPRQFTFDKRTGNYVPADQGGASSALGAAQPLGTNANPLPQGGTQQIVDQIAEQANRMIAAGVPEAQVEQWAMSQQGAQAAPVATQGSAFVGRAPEEQAALTTAAQEQAKLAVLPQTLQLQTAAGVQEATGKAEAEARVKREADLASAAQKKYVDANTTIGLLDQAEQLIGKSTGSRLGAARDTAAATFGVSTEGAQAIAQLQPIAAALTLAVPRMEGPQSDADRMLYQKAAGDFANPEVPTETRLAALQQMRVLAQKYVNTGGRPAAAPKTYSVGQTVEHNGKVYRVVGGDPSDPDLEEVR